MGFRFTIWVKTKLIKNNIYWISTKTKKQLGHEPIIDHLYSFLAGVGECHHHYMLSFLNLSNEF